MFVTVDLEENVRLVGILRDAEATLRVGLPVEVRFEDSPDGAFSMPVLVADQSAGG